MKSLNYKNQVNAQTMNQQPTENRRQNFRHEQKSEFNQNLDFSDTVQNHFVGKIVDKSKNGYKIIVKNMILPVSQMLHINKKTIHGETIKLNTIVTWSQDIIINGEYFTEFGIQL